MFTLILTLVTTPVYNMPSTSVTQVTDFASEAACVQAGVDWLNSVKNSNLDKLLVASTVCMKVGGI